MEPPTKDESLYRHTGKKIQSQKEAAELFCLGLALNHDCLPNRDKNTGVLGYQGSSPDEVALLEFAQRHQFEFLSSTDESIEVKIAGREKSFELVRKMEFTSDRKRASVIVKIGEEYILFTKGADSIIKGRLDPRYLNMDPKYYGEGGKGQAARHLKRTDRFLDRAARLGFRTLLVAFRVLTAYELDEFNDACRDAEKDLANRQKQLEIIYGNWENDLQLLGATVLEDRLQDQVPETIASLHQADIKVWMLTGDKLETAESIGFSSKLLTPDMEIVRCREYEDM